MAQCHSWRCYNVVPTLHRWTNPRRPNVICWRCANISVDVGPMSVQHFPASWVAAWATTIQVIKDGAEPETYSITSGVSQTSMLRLLLFLILIITLNPYHPPLCRQCNPLLCCVLHWMAHFSRMTPIARHGGQPSGAWISTLTIAWLFTFRPRHRRGPLPTSPNERMALNSGGSRTPNTLVWQSMSI